MKKEKVPDLRELFKQAAEIARQVPESMQEAAFNKAVDLLTGAGERESLHTPERKRTKQISSDRGGGDGSSALSLLEQIDSTKYPKLRLTAKVLDRSLMVLKIAFSEHNLDGLSPMEISRVLTDKFRLNTTDAAVRMALGKVPNLVNRIPRGSGYIYRIMGPGEEYLAELDHDEAARGQQTRAIKRRRKGANKVNQSSKSAEKKSGGAERAGKKTDGRSVANRRSPNSGIGPKAAILDLAKSGFFASAKTGPEVQKYLREKRGFNLDTDQLRMAMLRLVRDGVLERGADAEGNYEYRLLKTNA